MNKNQPLENNLEIILNETETYVFTLDTIIDELKHFIKMQNNSSIKVTDIDNIVEILKNCNRSFLRTPDSHIIMKIIEDYADKETCAINSKMIELVDENRTGNRGVLIIDEMLVERLKVALAKNVFYIREILNGLFETINPMDTTEDDVALKEEILDLSSSVIGIIPEEIENIRYLDFWTLANEKYVDEYESEFEEDYQTDTEDFFNMGM